MGIERLLRLIRTGAPLSSGEVNRPLRQLDQTDRYLWEVLQSAGAGATVYARRQVLEAEAAVGHAVYYSVSAQKFLRGLATTEVNGTGGVVTSASAQVWGIVATKHNATLGDILLFGIAEIDISNAIVGTPAYGTYYLSGTYQGKLVAQTPPVSVAVLRRIPGGKVYVMPQFVDFIDRHNHYVFDLTCEPAGTTTPPTLNGIHTMTGGNADAQGWLPADHPVFENHAPPGAVFGYNLSAHAGLADAWPPVPLLGAALEWNKALTTDVGFTGVPLGSGGLCVLDQYGIWWMSNCYGDVPWPLETDTTVSVSTSYSDSVGAECPRHNTMALRLYFAKANFAVDSAVVLSLVSADSRVKVTCAGTTTPASTGHLAIALDLDLVVNENVEGYQALKTFDAETGEFGRGLVVEGVYSGSSNVTVQGTTSSSRTISDVVHDVQHGLVKVVVDPADTKLIEVAMVRLDGAEEAYYGDPPLMYLEFVAGTQREYRGKILVPDDLAITGPQLSLRFWVLGKAAGTLPQLTFTGRIVSRPSAGLTSPETLPLDATEFSITCDTTGILSATNQYVEAESEPFAVEAGDTVYFTVKRDASDGYAAAVGIVRQLGVITAG